MPKKPYDYTNFVIGLGHNLLQEQRQDWHLDNPGMSIGRRTLILRRGTESRKLHINALGLITDVSSMGTVKVSGWCKTAEADAFRKQLLVELHTRAMKLAQAYTETMNQARALLGDE